MGLGAVGAHHHPITHGQVVQKSENRAAGARFSLGDVKQSWERVEGGSMEAATMGLGAFGAHDRPIACGEPGGAEKRKASRWGSVFPGRCETRLGEGVGGSMEAATMCLGAFGAHDCPIARGEPDGAKKQEPSRRGSAFPGRCEMRLGEGEGGSNRGVRMSLGAVGARNTQGGGRGPLIPVNQ
jgi:hypothetical protein